MLGYGQACMGDAELSAAQESGGQSPVWRQRLELLGLLRLAGWRWRAVLWVLIGMAAAVPALFAVTVGVLVARVPAALEEGLGSPEGGALWAGLVAVSAVLVVERSIAPVLDVARYRVGRDIDGAVRTGLLAVADDHPRIDRVEEGRVQSLLALVKGGLFGTAGSAAVAAAGVVGRYLQTLLALAVVAWFSVALAAVVGVVIVAIRRRWHGAFSSLANGLLDAADDLRRVTYTAELVTTPPAGKEVRVFGLTEWLVMRARGFWADAVAGPFEVRALLRRSANVELAILGGCYVATFVLAARATATGALGLGALTAILQAQFSAAQLIAPTTDDFSTGPGIAALHAAREVTDRLAHEPPDRATVSAVAGGSTGTIEQAMAVPPDIVFDEVSFTYPGAARPVLEHVDLQLAAAGSVALVGLNAAGKTTLVKLLCGLYEPTGGQILVDGVPLGSVAPPEWRERVAVIFQDFVRYELTARDNVRLAAPHAPADLEALDRAATAAGARDIIAALSAGWDTVLSRQYPGGADLSGGQWQRIALARALFAVDAGAGLLVLDEPTANLDVRAEAELFDRFLGATATTTSLLISHRFSTVRRAERIAVLDEGRIIETGTHAALIDQRGRYAELFRLQAERFGPSPTGTAADPGDQEQIDA